MRPLRAFTFLSAALVLWGGWRFDEASRTYAAILAARPKGAASRPVRQIRLPLIFAALDEPIGGEKSARFPAPQNMPAGHAQALPGGRAMAQADTPSVPPAASQTRPSAGSTDPAHALAARAYAAMATGDRRAAARDFEAALNESRRHANAGIWQAELASLRKQWRIEAYSLMRKGRAGAFADRPLLGGGQSGARAGYTPDPLAHRPLELFGRFNIAHDWADVDRKSAQAAIGAAWMPLGRKGPSVSAERLIAVGKDARAAWALRVAGGAWHAADSRMPLDLSAYAEAGIVGAKRRDLYAGGQALALYPILKGEKTQAGVGAGIAGSVQDGDAGRVSRLEIGPGAQISHRIGADATIELRAEYRVRIAGDAAPGSGPAVTVATHF